MSSSISSSNHVRFLGWVLLALFSANLVVRWIPWAGVAASKRDHQRAAAELAGATDFLVVGDSKAGYFSVGCLMPWFPGYRGLVFSADSVTPIFYYNSLREIRNAVPEFKPRVVFIFVGANNFNANGQHVQREYTFFNELDLGDTWDLSVRQGDFASFAEALLSRLLPLYGKRVMITHLQIGEPAAGCRSTAAESYEVARQISFAPTQRDAILDKNYYDIYRRSVYESYRSSPLVSRATEKLIEEIKGYGGTPILVLPPVTAEIRGLEHQLIGDAFDRTVVSIADEHGARVLDLRDRTEYEFADVNHLSFRGAHDVAVDYFLPILEQYQPTAHAADSRELITR